MEPINTDSMLSTALFGVRSAARACPVTRHKLVTGVRRLEGCFLGVLLDRTSVEKAEDQFLLLLRGLGFSRLVFGMFSSRDVRLDCLFCQSQHGHLRRNLDNAVYCLP